MIMRHSSPYSSCFGAIKATLSLNLNLNLNSPPRIPFLRCLLCFFSASPTQNPHFMAAEYLVTSCGFSPEKAAEASKHLNRIKSPQQPDSVLDFFRSYGFNEVQIRKVVSWNPRWLGFDVEKTLEIRFRELQDLGFARSDLAQLVVSSPSVLNHNFSRIVLPKIELWKGLLGSTNCLMKFLRKNQWILSYSIEKTILPNLTLLRSCGIPDRRISLVVKNHPRFILQKPSSMKTQAELVEGLGIPRQSGMFLWALHSVRMVSRARLKVKLELMRSLGWSELEFLAAFRRAPVFLSVSEMTMRRKMDFLVKEAGCNPSYLALKPVLLMYSLEKRLIPRYRVMEILMSRGLRGGDYRLHTIMDIPEKQFIEKFVLCHKKEAPELYQAYITGRGM